jgi:hypothetical protein
VREYSKEGRKEGRKRVMMSVKSLSHLVKIGLFGCAGRSLRPTTATAETDGRAKGKFGSRSIGFDWGAI